MADDEGMPEGESANTEPHASVPGTGLPGPEPPEPSKPSEPPEPSEPAPTSGQEPSLELDIDLDESLLALDPAESGAAKTTPVTSEQAAEASGTYTLARDPARAPTTARPGRRHRNVAGVHPSLAGVDVVEDPDAASDAGAGLPAVPSKRRAAPTRPQARARRRPPPTRGYDQVGAAPTSSVRPLDDDPTPTASESSEPPAQRSGVWDPSKTGFYKPLPAARRLGRLWEEFGLRLGQRIAEVVGDDHVYLLLMAVLVGVTSGATAGLLLLWIARAVELFPLMGSAFPSFGWIYLILAPAIGGLMVGVLRVVARRYFGDLAEGIPAVIEAVGQQGRIKGSSGAVLGLGTGLTIASGGSVGHEGPTVAIGATVGSVVSRFFGLRMRRQTTMLGAGCAAGLASAFNAPLAGVIFTVEVVFKRSVGGNVGTMSVFTPLIVAAVAGTFTSYAIFGERVELIAPGDVAGDRLLLEMLFFLALAVVAGLLSPLMGPCSSGSSRSRPGLAPLSAGSGSG